MRSRAPSGPAARHTLGVIPEALLGLEVADDDADELVVTRDMRERKGEMDAAADAFVALPGGLGTLEELLEVWVAGTLGLHEKPVVVLDPDRRLRLAARPRRQAARPGFRPGRRAEGRAVWTSSVPEALDAVEAGLAVFGRPRLRATSARNCSRASLTGAVHGPVSGPRRPGDGDGEGDGDRVGVGEGDGVGAGRSPAALSRTNSAIGPSPPPGPHTPTCAPTVTFGVRPPRPRPGGTGMVRVVADVSHVTATPSFDVTVSSPGETSVTVPRCTTS